VCHRHDESCARLRASAFASVMGQRVTQLAIRLFLDPDIFSIFLSRCSLGSDVARSAFALWFCLIASIASNGTIKIGEGISSALGNGQASHHGAGAEGRFEKNRKVGESVESF